MLNLIPNYVDYKIELNCNTILNFINEQGLKNTINMYTKF